MALTVIKPTGVDTSANFVFDKISTGNAFTPSIVQNASTYDTRISLSSAAGIIEITSDGNSTQFSPAGQITLGGTSQIVGGTFGGSGIKLNTSQTDLFQSRGGNVTVQVGADGTIANTWTFAQNGSFTSPGTITGVNANLGNLVLANFFSGTLTTAAQPNITSIGTLTSLGVTGNITTGNLLGILANGNSNISIPAANGNVNISSAGNANIIIVTGTGANITGTLTTSGNITSLNANLGNLATANFFTGNGSGLTNLSGANVTGTVGNATSSTTSAEKTANTAIATTAFVDRLRSLSTPTTGTTGTLVVGDRGALVTATGAITVPASVFATRDVVTITNNSASSITISQGAGLTMYLVGTATTGNRTLAQRGMATVVFISATVAVMSGGGVT